MTFIERVSGGSADAGSNVSTRPRSWRPSWQSFLFQQSFFFVTRRTVFQLWNYGYIYIIRIFSICLECLLESMNMSAMYTWAKCLHFGSSETPFLVTCWHIYIYSITLLAFDITIYCVFPKHDSDSRPFPPFPGPWCWGSKHSTMQTATTGWGTDAPVMIESNGQGHW